MPSAAMAMLAIKLNARLLWRSPAVAGCNCKLSCSPAMPVNVSESTRSKHSTHLRRGRKFRPPSNSRNSGATIATRCSSELGRAPGSDIPVQFPQTTGYSALEKIRLSAEMGSTRQFGQFNSRPGPSLSARPFLQPDAGACRQYPAEAHEWLFGYKCPHCGIDKTQHDGEDPDENICHGSIVDFPLCPRRSVSRGPQYARHGPAARSSRQQHTHRARLRRLYGPEGFAAWLALAEAFLTPQCRVRTKAA